MTDKDRPMVPHRKESMPSVYGDTPSFLGCEAINNGGGSGRSFDVIFAGVPWEGTITWGSFSGCELAPRFIRHASARYGGFLPEYQIDLFDYLRLGDIGDVGVNPNNAQESMERIFLAAKNIYDKESIPFVLGGDHSISPEIVRALSESRSGQIGVLHFDSHLDNLRNFGEDQFPRCGPLYRISQIRKVRNESIVHIGIRGPRNSQAQFAFAQEIGATVFTIKHVREQGIEKVMNEALQIACKGTDRLYVTVCSDILDAGFNPGGPADFDGLWPHELFHALHTAGKRGIDGFDYVEVYPIQDPKSLSSHLASWAIIHALAGLAMKKKVGLSFSD